MYVSTGSAAANAVRSTLVSHYLNRIGPALPTVTCKMCHIWQCPGARQVPWAGDGKIICEITGEGISWAQERVLACPSRRLQELTAAAVWLSVLRLAVLCPRPGLARTVPTCLGKPCSESFLGWLGLVPTIACIVPCFRASRRLDAARLVVLCPASQLGSLLRPACAIVRRVQCTSMLERSCSHV